MYTRSKQGPVNYSNKRGQPPANQNSNVKTNQSNQQLNNMPTTTSTPQPQQNSPSPKKQPEVISTPPQQAVKQEPPATPTPAPKIQEDTTAIAMDISEIKTSPIKGQSGLESTIEKTEEGENESADTPAEKPVPAWLRKKGPGFKINKRIKRRRQNARLRKILQPKNAIMVLNELKTGIKFTIQEQSSSLSPTVFVVHAEVDGKVFIGQGLSKPLAKQNAAENALKSLLLEKLVKASKNLGGPLNEAGEENAEGEVLNNNATAETSNTTTDSAVALTPTPVPAPTGAAAGATGTAAPAAEGSQTGETPMETETVAAEDDMPWGSLASFALYRLFLDWQSQGTHVPFPRQSAAVTVPIETLPGLCKELYKPPQQAPSSSSSSSKGPAAPMKKIPENPTERHPVMLLNQLRPGTLYVEQSRSGVAPNITFIMGCTVDGTDYIGTAKNKKDAKKECAKAALAGSMNIVYN